MYRSCEEAPADARSCEQVGGVGYHYGIGQLEVTVEQWVTFLNTVDPSGTRDDLYDPSAELVGMAEVRTDRPVP